MKVWPIFSLLVPVGALALMGMRRVRYRWRVGREVAALKGLRRPGRRPRKSRR